MDEPFKLLELTKLKTTAQERFESYKDMGKTMRDRGTVESKKAAKELKKEENYWKKILGKLEFQIEDY